MGQSEHEAMTEAISGWGNSSVLTAGPTVWAAARDFFRPLALSAPTVAGCPECAARRALEAATDPPERTLVLTLDEIKALTRVLSWFKYPNASLYVHTHKGIESAEAKLKAAQPKETQ